MSSIIINPYRYSPVLFDDAFTRADGAIGASYTIVGTEGNDFEVSSNTLRVGANVSNFGAPSALIASGTYSANQWAQIRMVSVGALDVYGFDLWLRGSGTSDANKTVYGCFLGGDGSIGFYCFIDGAAGSEITGGGGPGTITFPGANDITRFEINGSALTVKINGTTVATATDSQIAGPGRPGLAAYVESSGAPLLYLTLDDFRAGNVQ